MKTLNDFTPEIKAKIPEYINNALDGIFDGKRYENFSLDNAEKAVYWNYEKCGKKKPIVIVAENIYEAQIYFNYLKANKNFHPLLNLLYNFKNNENKLFDKTSTVNHPWVVLDSSDKRVSGLNSIRYVLQNIPYEGKNEEFLSKEYPEALTVLRPE